MNQISDSLGIPQESQNLTLGITSLHVAAWSGNADTVIALLKAGVSPKARNRDGKRPIDFADQEGKFTGPAYWQLHEASLN